MNESKEMSVPQRVKVMLAASPTFVSLLPSSYRPMATRFINRAVLYITTCKNAQKIQQCTPGSIYTAVLQAAEHGLPLDGRMAHIVPYGQVATFQADYKGLVAVGKRHGLFKDAFARIVCENDEFDYWMEDGQFHVRYQPRKTNRGEVIGAFAVIVTDDGRPVVEYMDCDQIEAVRERSKAKDNGPWVTDWAEMAKKTVLRRNMKLYTDDPEMLDLLDKDDAADLGETTTVVDALPVDALPAPAEQEEPAPSKSEQTAKRLKEKKPKPAPEPEPEPEQQPETFDDQGELVQDEPDQAPTEEAPETKQWRDFIQMRSNCSNRRQDFAKLKSYILQDNNPCKLTPAELSKAVKLLEKSIEMC